MTFLPIVQRELRAAVRRRSTYRLRAWTALVAILISFCSWLLYWATRGGGNLGSWLFNFLTGYAFVLSSSAGIFLTADCLSQEKREGTLGLLFLTDLKGYDVVLGKVCAISLNALYGLLALLPVTAIPLLFGGVTGGEFWRTALALANALFFSLATGVFASAFGRETQRVMGVTFVLLALVVVVLPGLAYGGSLAGFLSAGQVGLWISPYGPFSSAPESRYFSRPGGFWLSLLLSHALGWFLLVLASLALPRQWRQPADTRARSHGLLERARPRSRRHVTTRAERGRALLELNPVLWLAGTDTGLQRLAWLAVAGWGVVAVIDSVSGAVNAGLGVPFGYGAKPFGFFLKSLAVIWTSRFFIEARSNGLLEMLLCTPLSSRDIIRGQALALKRAFLAPILVFIALMFFPSLLQILRFLFTPDFPRVLSGGFSGFLTTIDCVRLLADFVALFWVALWLSASLKKPNFAPALTILLVLVLPSFLCWLDVLADLVFIVWGASRVQQDLRWVLARPYFPANAGLLPPVIRQPRPPPPVLGN